MLKRKCIPLKYIEEIKRDEKKYRNDRKFLENKKIKKNG